MNKKEEAEYQARFLAKHLQELKAIGYKFDDLEPLAKLEYQANKWATEECNGEREYLEMHWEMIEEGVKNLFKGSLANTGFFINHDPRGYALKLESEHNFITYRDMGGYQILCPEFRK